MANIKLLWHCGEAVWETRRDYKAISPTASQPAATSQPQATFYERREVEAKGGGGIKGGKAVRAEERRRQGGKQGEHGVWDGITGGQGGEGSGGQAGERFQSQGKKKKGEEVTEREMEGRTSGAGGDSCSASSSLHASSPELTFDLLLTRTATRVHCALKSRCLLTRPKPKAFCPHKMSWLGDLFGGNLLLLRFDYELMSQIMRGAH